MSEPILFIEGDDNDLALIKELISGRPVFEKASYACDWAQARSECAQTTFRSVVIGRQFPKPDVQTFLNTLASTNPRCTVVLRHDPELFERPMEFLGKPCALIPPNLDGQALESTFCSALMIDEWRGNQTLVATVSQMTVFPSLPKLYQDVCNMLETPDSSLEEVGVLISNDPAMCATLLKVVNSTAFGLSTQVTTALNAVLFLGAAQTKSLLLFSQFAKFEWGKLSGFSIDDFWSHSVGVANIARWIMWEETRTAQLADAAYTGGILHDVGSLLIAANLPQQVEKVSSQDSILDKTLYEMESDLLGGSHAEIGAFLLAGWGLPYPILEAIGYHHMPQKAKADEMRVLTAVHAADRLEYEKRLGPDASGISKVDDIYLERIFSENPMNRWRALAGINRAD